MFQKKICMLGAFGVGKTSLVRRFVDTLFADSYLTTVGVKLDKKTVTVRNETVNLILWDIAGEDAASTVRTTYLRGSAGYLLVADSTRPVTLQVTRSIQSRAEAEIGKVPFILLLNKCDLVNEWAIADSEIDALTALGWTIRRTSARTGESVEAVFQDIAELTVR
ncbi:MAG TPA: Rab family GTPase [Burkholderiales bacterium]|nr:GTP-binding protein [Betaproteobacteria bacterium]HQR52366.1 Rab family GTPase [Burkholderiales bacterium]